jgi:hypothetical protein
MTEERVRVSREWLDLREAADAAARARDLVTQLIRGRAANTRWVIHDLGCGTGAMGRWLAPLLDGSQHWVLHDRDADLLGLAVADVPAPAPDGASVTVEARQSDVTRLRPADLAGATLITASALLDMLTADELGTLITACAGAGSPILLTLSVVGRVSLTPTDPLDERVAAAFNAHQRRGTDRGPLLGPDAVAFAIELCGQFGADVAVRPSPWRLGASHFALTWEWLIGWIGAACEHQSELTAEASDYLDRRRAQLEAGGLAITVGHADLLALPGPAEGASAR